MENTQVMTEEAKKGRKSKDKWLTVQISDEEHEALEQYCIEKGISKTTVIRDFLSNLLTYTELMNLLKKKAMQNVLDSLKQDVETEEAPKKSTSIIPEEIVKQDSIEADISDLFGE